MKKTESPNKGTDSLQRKDKQQLTHESTSRNWIVRNWKPVASVSGLLAAAGGGVALLDWASRAIEDVAVALNFFAQNTFSLLIFLAVIVQAVISNRQWRAMKDSIERTDVIIENMNEQLTSMQGQEKTMQGQLDVMERQLGEMHRQADLAFSAARPIIEISPHFQGGQNILLVLKNVGKSRATVQLKCKAILDNEIILDEEVPEFEVGIIGQDDFGQWARSFPIVAEMPVDDIMSGHIPLRMEITGTYKWEAGSYPINERRKYNDPIFQFKPRY